MKTLIVKKQLAALVSRSTRTIEQWMAEGVISFYKIKGTVLFDPDVVFSELEKFKHKSRFSD